MAKYDVTSPDGKTYEVNAPEGATEQDAIAYVQANFYSKNDNQPIPSPVEGNSFGKNLLIGTGKGMTDLYMGAKQLAGLASEDDAKRKRELDAPLMETAGGKIGSFAGQVATTAPALLIPGVNTYAGAALFGAGSGALQPTVEGESRALNSALGGVGGVVGQKIGRVIGNKISDKVTKNALLKAQNATKDATIKAAQDTGYNIPRSLYNPTFASNRVESFGGKAAVLQQASAKNQEVTNNLARKALGVADDTPLSVSTVDNVIEKAYKPYQDIAKVSPTAKNALAELKQAKNNAKLWFTSYNRSGNPEHLTKAQDFKQVADIAEQVIQDEAMIVNKPELLPALNEARKTIAKAYTVERAMNKGSGDIDARVLGRLFDKQKPLSDGLDEIGRFATTFPKASQPTQQSAGAGISALEPVAGAIYGGVGSMATGNPMGMLAGGIPLLRSPARALALSKMMQSQPNYGGQVLNLGNRLSPAYPYIGTGLGGLLGATSN